MTYIDGLSFACFHDSCGECWSPTCCCGCHMEEEEGEEWDDVIYIGWFEDTLTGEAS